MGNHLWLSQIRLCMALRIGVGKLKTWYSGVDVKPANSQAQFPFMRSFPSHDRTSVPFQYIRCVRGDGNSAVFLATREDDDSEIYVKFVQQYGQDVHRELEILNMAPELLAVVKKRTFKMIVMKAEQKSRSWDTSLDANDEEMVLQLRQIRDALRSKTYVHGDLRAPNILVCKDKTVKLIDFDWAGKAGVMCYPVQLNQKNIWPEDASIGQPIVLAHDDFMLDQICPGLDVED
jgi:serine/threonine protein kinase